MTCYRTILIGAKCPVCREKFDNKDYYYCPYCGKELQGVYSEKNKLKR